MHTNKEKKKNTLGMLGFVRLEVFACSPAHRLAFSAPQALLPLCTKASLCSHKCDFLPFRFLGTT